MDARRHRKAMRTLLVTILLVSAPLYVLWRVHRDDILGGVGDYYGHVPEFLYMVENEGVGFSHFDTLKHISVIYRLGHQDEVSRQRAIDAMSELEAWVGKELVFRDDDSREKPPAIKKFLMSDQPWTGTVPQGWSVLLTSAENPPLVPPAFQQDNQDAIVVIDDAGRYRAYLPVRNEDSLSKAERLLSKIATQQNLLFYLTNQTLMWEKAKRVARGLEPYPGH